MMYQRTALVIILVFLCVLTPGCTSLYPTRTPGGPPELTVPSWRLVSYYDGNGTMVPAGTGTNISLKFGEDGNASGFIDGCRRYSGRYTTLGETIKVTNLTEIGEGMCPETPHSREITTLYFTLLQKSPRFNVNGDTLIFGYYDAERYLVFSRT
jgi:heat shock protein HslJ